MIQCDRNYEKQWPRKRGDKQWVSTKLFSGVLLFAALLAIVWSPLLLMSTGTPLLKANPLLEVQVSTSIEGFPPIYRLEMVTRIHTAPDDRFNSWSKYFDIGYLNKDHRNETQLLVFTKGSEYSWEISPTSYKSLLDRVEQNPRPVSIITNLLFVRSGPDDSPNLAANFTTVLNDKQRLSLSETLRDGKKWVDEMCSK
eukprot:TRINITY_DN13386_c0_g2_i1.p1 TRINITY_DN13386_c0_g2~~TRINITY_DN13386_c0_g2_i1.p1  ORF type:complete len:198 (+),score=43.15 TRINITY_DN13386_c0_g2_i1:2-595(+)